MFSAVESEVAVTQVLRAEFETGFPFSSFSAAASSLVPAALSGSAAETKRPICGVRQAVGALERVLVHDLGERPGLCAGLERLLGPLGSELRDCRIVGCAEDDLLLLEAVADRRAPVDAHGDCSDAEDHQHYACNDPADFEELPHVVPPLVRFVALT